MALKWLDHVNIRTAELARLSRFYAEVLDLPAGARPPFGFAGAWHYCGERAAVHLVEVAQTPAGPEPRLEHFAFRASGHAQFLDRLRRQGVPYTLAVVPGTLDRQVNLHDPDGNHIEVQFAASEADDLGA